jgi:hypothetical protein
MIIFAINPSRFSQLLLKYFHALSAGEEGLDLKQQASILKKIQIRLKSPIFLD